MPIKRLADRAAALVLTIVPAKDAPAFQDTFRRIGQSIRLTDAR